MVRKLKFHEQKLLKKVDFISWKVDNNLHEVKIMRRYHVEKREDYTLYVLILLFIVYHYPVIKNIIMTVFLRALLWT